jgi:hypothetical protein
VSATKANPWNLPISLATLASLVGTSSRLLNSMQGGSKPAVIVGETVPGAKEEAGKEGGVAEEIGE